MLILHATLLCVTAAENSPTLNESAHLAAGISHWERGSFELYRVNPPLVRMVAALPAFLAGIRAPWDGSSPDGNSRPEFAVGRAFVSLRGRESFELITQARWATVGFSLLGAAMCYLWASQLYGPTPGLVALGLWCFSPDCLAHGSLITPDVGGTALGLAACFVYWRWTKAVTYMAAIRAGVVMGLAILARSPNLLTLLILPLSTVSMLAAARVAGRPAPLGRGFLIQLTLFVVVSVLVLNAGYRFAGTGQRLGSFPFVSRLLTRPEPDRPEPGAPRMNRFRETFLEEVRVPLPRDFVLGCDEQKLDGESYPHPGYLRGEFSRTGWWYFYLYALAIKTPLAVWGLCAISIRSRYRKDPGGGDRSGEIYLWGPALAVLLVVSSQMALNQHPRYAMPVLPAIYIFASAAAIDRRFTASKWGTVLLLTWFVASSLRTFPHTLAYFNEAAGGANGGRKHLIYSSLDWGQDVIQLERWVGSHPKARPLWVALSVDYDPAAVGLDFPRPSVDDSSQNVVSRLEPGWYAVSVNYVQGAVYDGRPGGLAGFQHCAPADRIGASIDIYHIGAADRRDGQ